MPVTLMLEELMLEELISVEVIMPVTLMPEELIVVPEPTIADVAVIIPTVTCEPEFSGGCASIDMVEADPEVAIAVIANPTKLSVLTLLATRLPSSLIVTPVKFSGKSMS